MDINEAKKFFEKFSLQSLESLDLILPNTDPIINAAYVSVYNKKFEEVRDEYEGMNEYDYITKVLNFNISELDDISKFNDDEISYLKTTFDDESMKNKIKRYKNNINNRSK